MKTYQDYLNERNQMLWTYKISEWLPLIERILAVKAFNRNLFTLNDVKTYPYFIEINNDVNDPTKISMTFNGSDEERKTFLTFLQEHGQTQVTQQPNGPITVDVGQFSEHMMPLIKQAMEDLSKNYLEQFSPYIEVSGYYPDVLKQQFKTQHRINDPNNLHGKIMKEIDDNLNKMFISSLLTNVLGDTLLSVLKVPNPIDIRYHTTYTNPENPLPNSDDDWPPRFGVSPKCYFSPKDSNDKIVFEFYIESAYFDNLKTALAKLTGVSINDDAMEVLEEGGGSYRYVKASLPLKTFYEEIMPLFRTQIHNVIDSPNTLYTQYLIDSKFDPDVMQAKATSQVNDKGEPQPDKVWRGTPIEFPTPVDPKPDDKKKHSESKHGFFYKLKMALCCQHEEDPKPTPSTPTQKH